MKLSGPVVMDEFEQVVTREEPETGLRAIIAVHSTARGPALGGVRMWPYPGHAAALDDCLRLARAMTRKTAAAGLRLGGGKSVIIGDSATDKTTELLRAHGRFIQSLGGRYVPGIDVGTGAEEMRVIGTEAATVTCTEGDPSYLTALGAFAGITAAVEHVYGSADLSGRTAVVQGVGHVGHHLARLLTKASAAVLVTDVVRSRAETLAAEIGAGVLEPEEALATRCDVLAPCALGEVVNPATMPALRCEILAGVANNVLSQDDLATPLAARGITFVPDFILSAGGITFLDEQLRGGDERSAVPRVLEIGPRVGSILAEARAAAVTPLDAATALAEERLRLSGPTPIDRGTTR
ncbi:leucine dehydrogenase [Acrocarpospora phusangensis]|uniref:Leucine dehydrogenase n=1 Tax=Acrocarpospora phusangensis TaxID=1070424 RepID=A0A919UPJ6_9ACTN|nr:Glu/Leu/Phe/Val dehydrogenase [Acrocarpospora phusangensis]GIH25742.1 leucine dehydrogenase [Acrocarpospora phusangensis]